MNKIAEGIKAMKNATELTQEYLKSILHYDPDTGEFTCIVDVSTKMRAGSLSGTTDRQGYRVIMINWKRYRSHRLAWFYMTGSFPKDQIDHINNSRHDNKWSNLREATNSQNNANKGKNKNNTSGFKGVSWHKTGNKWHARIKFKWKTFHLGLFTCKYEAACAYNKKALEFFGEFAYQNIIPTE